MAMKRLRFGGGDQVETSIDMANLLMLLSRSTGAMINGVAEEINHVGHLLAHSSQPPPPPPPPPISGRMFECKTCNRRFPSFQALGGHRASHKKTRTAAASAVAAAGDVQAADGDVQAADGRAAKPRMHECSICGLEFPVGQALGGHMRRHRAAPEALGQGLEERKRSCSGSGGRRTGLCLDLNKLPPLEKELGLKKKGLSLEIVDFPMVNCFLGSPT